MILRSVFSRDNWGTHMQLLQKVQTLNDALNTCFFPFGASMSILIFCKSCIWVSRLSSVWIYGSQNLTVIVGKGSNTQTCWKSKEFVGPEGFFWRTAGSLTVQDKQETHEQPSLNKKTKQKNTAVDHSGNNTILHLEQGHFYKFNYYILLCTINIFYVKCLLQVSTK